MTATLAFVYAYKSAREVFCLIIHLGQRTLVLSELGIWWPSAVRGKSLFKYATGRERRSKYSLKNNLKGLELRLADIEVACDR